MSALGCTSGTGPSSSVGRNVFAEDAVRKIGRQWRLVVTEAGEIGLRRQTPVLRPLDLRGEVGRGTEAKRSREPVADLPQEQRLAREDPARISGEAPEESERSG